MRLRKQQMAIRLFNPWSKKLNFRSSPVTTFVERKNLWTGVLAALASRLNRHVFDQWFRSLQLDSIDEANKLVYLSTGQITMEWITLYYKDTVLKCLSEFGLEDYSLAWNIDKSENIDETFAEPQNPDEFIEEDSEVPERSGVQYLAATAGVNGSKTHAAGTVSVYQNSDPAEHSLNPKYTFEKFVVGSCNQFAHAASLGAAESPGKTYNPLFIYGGTGLGKTHLMHAIGHSIKQRNSHLKVSYITSEKFMNELINAIRYDKTESFREKYRSIDVLLMDDVQFFAGKERTQEEFFHTFNALHNRQKQIVISSDCPPRDIPTLEERLHSRFEWGLIADIEPPDLETKVAILKRKADMDGIFLPDDIAIFIAGKVKSNVRELEGSLVRLLAISSLRGIPISKMLAQEAMKNIIDSERPEGLTIERIARFVAAHYKLSIEELKSKNNSRPIAFPRQVAMYLSKRLTKSSYPEIGREFGGKHHTTVMHSFEKIETLAKSDRNFHKQLNEFIDNLCS